MNILIIISACNEAPSLAQFLPRLKVVAKTLGDKCDILVIDDGSSDKTGVVSRKNGCLVLRNRENAGIGTSLRRGYRKAIRGGYDVTITMDADGQHDENFLHTMVKSLEKGADIVVASRYHPKSERIQVPLDRDLLNIAMTAQIQVVTGWNVTDPLCGFWAMRRKCFEFALKHGRQARYGVHLEHLVKFWYLANPKPKLVEVPHPAIYGNHGTLALLTREYSPNNKEARIDRFGTHALHVVEAIADVQRKLPPEVVDREMASRRRR